MPSSCLLEKDIKKLVLAPGRVTVLLPELTQIKNRADQSVWASYVRGKSCAGSEPRGYQSGWRETRMAG